MKRRIFWPLFFVLILILTTVSIGLYYYPAREGSNIAPGKTALLHPSTLKCAQKVNLRNWLGESWINYTIKRLHLAQQPDGGFTEIVDTITPTLISTYYFVEALHAVNRTPTNVNQTLVWLHREEASLINSSNLSNDYAYAGQDKFSNLYYLVTTLNTLNSTPRNSDKIIDFVLSTRKKNGAFEYDGVDVTDKAVEMLHALGYNMSGLHDTRDYLLGEFENTTPPKVWDEAGTMKFLLRFNTLTKALGLLQVDYTSLDIYKKDVMFIKVNISKRVDSLLKFNPPLFMVEPLAESLHVTHTMTPSASEEIYKYVVSLKLPDGGFNLFGKDYGEFQGTYYAVKTIVLTDHTPDEDTIRFIENWESPLGGFAFPFQGHGGPVLTYMGVYVAEKIEMPLNRTAIARYLSNALYNRWPYSDDNPGPLYSIYMAYSTLNITLSPLQKDYLRNETARLTELYLRNRTNSLLMDTGWISLLRLDQVTGVRIGRDTKKQLIRKILSQKNPDGTFGPPSNNTMLILYRTENAVLLLYALGYNYTNETTANFILRMEHDGGWGGPDLYNTYRAVSVLAYMGYCPKDVQSLISFIHSLRYRYGGFLLYKGDKGHGSLQDTYYAIRTLELVGAS